MHFRFFLLISQYRWSFKSRRCMYPFFSHTHAHEGGNAVFADTGRPDTGVQKDFRGRGASAPLFVSAFLSDRRTSDVPPIRGEKSPDAGRNGSLHDYPSARREKGKRRRRRLGRGIFSVRARRKESAVSEWTTSTFRRGKRPDITREVLLREHERRAAPMLPAHESPAADSWSGRTLQSCGRLPTWR